jgi:hypothetical protein
LRSLISGLPIVFAQLFVPHVHADLQAARAAARMSSRNCSIAFALRAFQKLRVTALSSSLARAATVARRRS